MTSGWSSPEAGSGLGPGGAGLSAGATATPEEVASTYDAWAGGYDDDVIGWGYEVPHRLAASVVEAGAGRGEVLDAGCGTGLAGVALAAAGVEAIVGFDFSAESLSIAQRRDVYRELQELDLNEPLPFDSDRFAAVVSAGVFTYVIDAAVTLREILRVCRRDGIVLFTMRTDLWDERGFPLVLDGLAADGLCAVSVSDQQPYLPGHPEFAEHIGVYYVTLVVA